MVTLLAAALLLAAGSCGQSGARSSADASGGGDSGDAALTDRGDPRAALCARYAAASDGSVPTFAVVQQIFDDNCTSCHSVGAALDLSGGRAYADLVGRPAPASESCGGILVTPGDPAASYLYEKLTVSPPCAGAQMPLDEFFSSIPLPTCVTAIVRSWIEAGAPPAPADAAAGGGG